jgi:hypothetical protein
MEGKVTCKCGHRVNRWKNYKEQGVAEDIINELSQDLKSRYKQAATAQTKELKKHSKGEYGDIVKRMMDRRAKGLARLKEDGMGGGAVSAGPTNVVGGGAIAGSGGKGGEPGVDLRKKRKNDPRLPMGIGKRNPPKM